MSSDHPQRRLDIPALIGSRICHDLISPIGAIGNGIELLSMAGVGGGPELSLISESVANANARIRFYRLAFGQSGQDQATSRSEILSILRDLYAGSRMEVFWQVNSDCRRDEAKAALLALQCLESAMPYGGRAEVTRTDGRWQVVGTAAKLRIDEALWTPLLTGADVEEVTPAQVHFALLPDTLQGLGRKLVVTRSGEQITLGF
ncbi:histidine phosphotransferase family protein [Tropicimonas sediminicola]|uniref:Histidine phosphotransferase ChpT n=1 Tax=Tropicimonas sediminicola TaxID=1031541 RepID=A0A239JR24_9RHOB|nr:histidine phosphotransferase family protein [Tropicimonas sediminicola]SNT08297.1 histidine phosphotransferase ChpT [Tropicimonas sediminicola]